MPSATYKNTVLKHLDRACLGRLQLRPVELPILREIEYPGNTIDNLFFIETGIASMTTMFESGAQVETSMFGYESVIGVSGLMGVRRSLNRIFMQLPGHGYTSSIQVARDEFQKGGTFQQLSLRYVQMQLTLSIQNAACNAMHTCEQRLARWLLICFDRSRTKHLDMAQVLSHKCSEAPGRRFQLRQAG
jgi:hypothetical protein